jgi:hypothetical protein
MSLETVDFNGEQIQRVEQAARQCSIIYLM